MKGFSLIICIFMALFLTACNQSEENRKVVLTTGFGEDELFRIEKISCKKQELMVYLTNMQNQYESVFGDEIWQTDLNGVTLEQNLKDTALARIAQIKSMNLLAGQYEVVLDDKETGLVKEVAALYYNSLNAAERECMDVTLDTIENLYMEYAVAGKVYQYIIKDINPEISDDEARTITVQHILIKTYTLDGTGQKVEYSQEMKEKAYAEAVEVWNKAMEEENFEQLIVKYSEDDKGTYSFGKGEMEESFETAAFNLGTGEISSVVETSFGYHIIKCINTFNREETDNNKIKIVNQKREEVFGQEYDTFVAGLTKTLNENLWEKISFIHNEEVETRNFFDLYEEHFQFSAINQ